MVNIQKNNHLSIINNHLAYANRRNTPNSAATPNKPPIQPNLSTNYEVIITNKANFGKAQMNVNKVITKDYENELLCRRGENKPNQTQFPQITTISLFTAVNLRKEFRRFWFRYRSAPLFYAIHLTQDAQKKIEDTINFPTAIQRFSADFVQITLVLTEIVRLQSKTSGQKPTYLVKSYRVTGRHSIGQRRQK